MIACEGFGVRGLGSRYSHRHRRGCLTPKVGKVKPSRNRGLFSPIGVLSPAEDASVPLGAGIRTHGLEGFTCQSDAIILVFCF